MAIDAKAVARRAVKRKEPTGETELLLQNTIEEYRDCKIFTNKPLPIDLVPGLKLRFELPYSDSNYINFNRSSLSVSLQLFHADGSAVEETTPEITVATWPGVTFIKRISVEVDGRYAFTINNFNYAQYCKALTTGDQIYLDRVERELSGFYLDDPSSMRAPQSAGGRWRYGEFGLFIGCLRTPNHCLSIHSLFCFR